MSASLEIVRAGPSLLDLAETANREYRLGLRAGTVMVEHAINTGEALLEAKQQVERGGWDNWLAANFEPSLSVARQCMRIARHKQIVIEGQATNFKGALRLLHSGATRDSRIDPVQHAEALRLRAQGLTYREIAQEIDIPKSRAYRWCNPRAEKERLRKAHQRSMAGRRALNRQKRDAAVRKAGGSVAEAYSLVRKALQACEQASAETVSVEVRRSISDATNRLYNAEDALVKAVRLDG